MARSACVVHEWGSLLVLHRREPKRWQFAVAEEGTEEAAIKAAKDMMNVDLVIKKKLFETLEMVLYQAEIKDGIPKVMDETKFDRVRYIEIPILWGKPEELSYEVQTLFEKIKSKEVNL